MESTEIKNKPHAPKKPCVVPKRLCRKTVHFVLPVFLVCSILTSVTVYAEGQETMEVSIAPAENLVYSGKAQKLMSGTVSVKDTSSQKAVEYEGITYSAQTTAAENPSSLTYSSEVPTETDAGTYYV